MPVDLNQLGVLAVLLQTRSVTVTARKLGISQPSVSRTLGDLRRIVGDPLLVRTGNRMVRTTRGEELVERVSDWLQSASGLIAPPEFDPQRLERRFRIASTDFGVLSVVAPAMAAILAEAPGVSIDLVPLNAGNAEALASGEVDLAVSGLDDDPVQLHNLFLFTDSFDCVMRPDHPLAGDACAPLGLDELLAWPHVGLTVGEAEVDRVSFMLGRLAQDRRVVASLPYFYAAPDVLVASDMLMTIPHRAARRFASQHGLVQRPAPAELGTLTYRVLWHDRAHRDPARAWLCGKLAGSHSPGA